MEISTAEYTLTWEADWNVSDHRKELALPAGAHFTTLIGASHQVGEALWSPDEVPTTGIERVAELGITAELRAEIEALNDTGVASEAITLSGVFDFPTTRSVTFSVGADLPEVSFISMIAPSPDWFVGVSGLSLLQDDQWLDEVTVDLVAWDAGTEEGSGFSLNNTATNPKQGVALLNTRASPFESDALLGQLRFERIDVMDSTPEFSVIDANGLAMQVQAIAYSGPVTYLEYQLIGTTDSDVVTGAGTNDFINLAAGDDAASGGDGRDVLDGGTGSNFLTGGNGEDTFFLDGRSGVSAWSTITDFNADQLNIWGWAEGTSQLLLTEESAGADGFKGATYHYDLNNDGVIDTSVTFSGLSLTAVPNSSVQIVEDLGYVLFI